LLPATIFDKVTYYLHESFGKKATQTFKQPPFRLEEQGWGEFELKLVLHPLGRGAADVTLMHDLNFLEERYESVRDVVCFFASRQPDTADHCRHSRIPRVSSSRLWRTVVPRMVCERTRSVEARRTRA
jgi:transcription initiation factor IIF auxiliary subunit